MSATKTRRFRLEDVDGTVPGVCVMTIVRVTPDTPEDKVLVSVDRFTEEPGRPNPRRFAESLWSSIEDDWPGCRVNYAANERARYLLWRSRMEALLSADDVKTPREYWQAFA